MLIFVRRLSSEKYVKIHTSMSLSIPGGMLLISDWSRPRKTDGTVVMITDCCCWLDSDRCSSAASLNVIPTCSSWVRKAFMRPTSCLEKKSLQGDKRNEDFILEGFSASKEPEYKSVKRLETHAKAAVGWRFCIFNCSCCNAGFVTSKTLFKLLVVHLVSECSEHFQSQFIVHTSLLMKRRSLQPWIWFL